MTRRAYHSAIRGDLSRILDKALCREPQRRYATVAALADDLQRWLDGLPVHASGNGLRYRLGKFARRNALAVATSGLLVVALVGTSAWALHSAWKERLQRDAALREVARSNAVHDYVMLMFGDVAQRQDSGTLSARDVLRSSASQLATRFADQPDMGQRVAMALASLYSRLGDTEGAVPLLEQVLSWPGIDDSPDIQADARAQLAELEYFRSNIARARTLLEQARAWWATDPRRNGLLLNESLITLSQIERAEGRLDAAIATLARAIDERRTLLRQPDRVLAMALNTQSVALIAAGHHERALRAADDALIVFRALDQEASGAALAAVSNRATASMNAGRIDAAERDFREVMTRRAQMHGPSPELAGVQSNLAQVLMRKNRHAEAIALWESGLDMAITHGGATARYALPIRGHLAEAYVAVGRIPEAERLAEEAVRIAVEGYGEDSIFSGAARRARASVRIAQRRPVEARTDLDAAAAIFMAAGASGERALQSLEPLRARLALLSDPALPPGRSGPSR
jgi:tetratricopeptide (TPR) repeat protein